MSSRLAIAREGTLGALSRDVDVRLLNCSASGCLLETSMRLEVGTVGVLNLAIDGQEVADEIQVVRCQPLGGAGSRCHVGVRFLWLTPPAKGSIRRAISRAASMKVSSGAFSLM